MGKRVAKPRRVKHSETLDRLNRLKRKFAVRPAGIDDERWDGARIAKRQTISEKSEQKKLIRDADHSIKGIDFPAKEMAQIIRSWMSQDD